MKILYVSHLFLPHYSGGTEVLTFQIAREMQQRGHTVNVFTCEDWRGGTQPVVGFDGPYEGIPVHRLRLNAAASSDPLRAQYYFPAVEEYLLARLRQAPPDLIHVHHFGHVTTAAATAAYQQGIPVFFTATDFWLICPTSQLLRYDHSLCNGPTNIAKCAKCISTTYARARPYEGTLRKIPEPVFNWVADRAHWLRSLSGAARGVSSLVERADWNRQIAAKFSRLLVASQFMRERFEENRVPTGPMETLGFGIDTRWAHRLSTREFRSPVRFGFIGAVAPHKGLHVLIEAFRRLRRVGQAELDVYGRLDFSPSYGDSVRGLAAGVEGINFRGTFPHHQIAQVLSNLDVLVIPSIWYENMPLVLHSALAARLPVIVSDMGGLREMVRDNESGLVVPAGDPNALAVALERCLREPALLPRLSRQMPVAKDIGVYVDELLERYESVMAQT